MRALDACDKPFKYIHFDFECMQNDFISCSEGYTPSACIKCQRTECGTKSPEGQSNDCDFGYSPKCFRCNTDYCGRKGHVPNFVCSRSTCTHCMGDDAVTPESQCTHCSSRCTVCIKKTHHLKHVDCGKLFQGDQYS